MNDEKQKSGMCGVKFVKKEQDGRCYTKDLRIGARFGRARIGGRIFEHSEEIEMKMKMSEMSMNEICEEGVRIERGRCGEGIENGVCALAGGDGDVHGESERAIRNRWRITARPHQASGLTANYALEPQLIVEPVF